MHTHKITVRFHQKMKNFPLTLLYRKIVQLIKATVTLIKWNSRFFFIIFQKKNEVKFRATEFFWCWIFFICFVRVTLNFVLIHSMSFRQLVTHNFNNKVPKNNMNSAKFHSYHMNVVSKQRKKKLFGKFYLSRVFHKNFTEIFYTFFFFFFICLIVWFVIEVTRAKCGQRSVWEKSTVLSSCKYHTETNVIRSGLVFHFEWACEKLTFMDL